MNSAPKTNDKNDRTEGSKPGVMLIRNSNNSSLLYDNIDIVVSLVFCIYDDPFNSKSKT